MGVLANVGIDDSWLVAKRVAEWFGEMSGKSEVVPTQAE